MDRSTSASDVKKPAGRLLLRTKLQKLDFDQMRPGERIQSDEYSKDAVADFALWKARTEADGEVFWESPWGQGRPGGTWNAVP